VITIDLIEGAKAMNATLWEGAKETPRLFPSVSTDTRKLQAGQAFFCLQGPNFDGHDFIEQAIGEGASVIVHAKPVPESIARGAAFLRVDNTLGALQTLAHYARMKWGRPLVAVTGSAGKTTTRSFTAALLTTKLRTHESKGNLNNEIGVPLSLLCLEDSHEVAVLELGMNHPGELRALARLARPDVVTLTNVAPVHLEFFSGLDEIAAAKGEILESLPPSGLIVYNADDSRVTSLAKQRPARRLSFGIETPADVTITAYHYLALDRMEFEIETPAGRFSASVPFTGRHFLYNLAAAVAVAFDFRTPLDLLRDTIRRLEPPAMRGRVLRFADGRYAGLTIWDDSYNANPQAMASVLDAVAGLDGFKRKIAALGDMLELGPSSPEWHLRLGEKAADSGVNLLVAVGKQGEFVCRGARAAGMDTSRMQRFEHAAQAADFLKAELRAGDFLLVKGSRGIGMDLVVRSIEGQ
jgi:UDP-N-acetylmuramoyl-tripeptide--D-alanyl-D-alanine ligase